MRLYVHIVYIWRLDRWMDYICVNVSEDDGGIGNGSNNSSSQNMNNQTLALYWQIWREMCKLYISDWIAGNVIGCDGAVYYLQGGDDR